MKYDWSLKQDARREERRPAKKVKTSKGNARPVNQLSIEGKYIKTWDSLHSLEVAHKYDRSAIIRTCNGKQNSSYGFKWEYVSEKHFEIIGTTINEMKIISLSDPYIRPDGKSERRYNVLCHCGKYFATTRSCLISADIKSCGCKKGVQNEFKRTKQPLYYVWQQIKRRCLITSAKEYKNYGARGISVCNEWAQSFISFYNWSINNGYMPGLSIDRIDNNGNYSPENCRWADQKTQCNNMRKNRLFTLNGITKTLTQWVSGSHTKYNRVYHRIFTGGWSLEKALNTPANEKHKNKKYYTTS